MKQSIEVTHFHPLVAQWLTDNNYSYIHEYRLPDFGRVDFYATHSDGHRLFVECKLDKGISKGILQLVAYLVQVSDVGGAIAAISTAITPSDIRLAQKHKIRIIAIDVPENFMAVDTPIIPPVSWFIRGLEFDSHILASLQPQLQMEEIPVDFRFRLLRQVSDRMYQIWRHPETTPEHVHEQIYSEIEMAFAHNIQDILKELADLEMNMIYALVGLDILGKELGLKQYDIKNLDKVDWDNE